jgi:glycosyltransferase involved in cell wall biosynthesis
VTRTVVHYSDSTTFGGTERAILRLMAATDRGQWTLVLLHHPDAPAALVNGARAAGADTREVRRVKGKLDVRTLSALAGQIQGLGPSVFHAHLHWPLACKYGIAAASAARVPAVVGTAQLHVEIDRGGFVDLQHRLISQLVARYIAVSQDVASHLVRRFQVPDAKIVVIPNAVDEAEIAAGFAHPAIDWPVSARRKAALILARLEPEKGVDVAIDAIAKVDDVDLVIAGTGSCRATLEAKVAQLHLGDRVHFLGQRDDPASLLARADVFVLPSHVEGLPLSVLEAMSAGVPVIATDIGGTREAIENEKTGLLVLAGDARALATAIRRVFADPDTAADRASAAREVVAREFTSSIIAARTAVLYKSLL